MCSAHRRTFYYFFGLRRAHCVLTVPQIELPFLVVQQWQSVAKYPKLIISGIIEHRCVVGTYKEAKRSKLVLRYVLI